MSYAVSVIRKMVFGIYKMNTVMSIIFSNISSICNLLQTCVKKNTTTIRKRGTGLICYVKLVYWLIKLIKLIGWMEALGLRFEVGGKI
jgi:hypothetical protein